MFTCSLYLYARTRARQRGSKVYGERLAALLLQTRVSVVADMAGVRISVTSNTAPNSVSAAIASAAISYAVTTPALVVDESVGIRCSRDENTPSVIAAVEETFEQVGDVVVRETLETPGDSMDSCRGSALTPVVCLSVIERMHVGRGERTCRCEQRAERL